MHRLFDSLRVHLLTVTATRYQPIQLREAGQSQYKKMDLNLSPYVLCACPSQALGTYPNYDCLTPGARLVTDMLAIGYATYKLTRNKSIFSQNQLKNAIQKTLTPHQDLS